MPYPLPIHYRVEFEKNAELGTPTPNPGTNKSYLLFSIFFVSNLLKVTLKTRDKRQLMFGELCTYC